MLNFPWTPVGFRRGDEEDGGLLVCDVVWRYRIS